MTSIMFERMDRMFSYSPISRVGSGRNGSEEALGFWGETRLFTSGVTKVEGGFASVEGGTRCSQQGSCLATAFHAWHLVFALRVLVGPY